MVFVFQAKFSIHVDLSKHNPSNLLRLHILGNDHFWTIGFALTGAFKTVKHRLINTLTSYWHTHKKSHQETQNSTRLFCQRTKGGFVQFWGRATGFFYLFHIEIQFDNLPPSSYQWYLDRQHVLIGPCFKTINTICLMIILEAATNSMNSERFAPTFGHLVFQQMYTHHLWLHYQTIPSISIDTKFTSPGQLVLWLHI